MKMRIRYILQIIIFLFIISPAEAQTMVLQPGFDKNEYIDLLKISARQIDTPWTEKNMTIPYPQQFSFIYRSPVMGLENLWDLWLGNTNKIAVLSIRGTTAKSVSWLENFYAAMVPAQGTLYFSNTDSFVYRLADNPKAAVHAGWLLGMASISGDILHKVDSCYKAGYRDFVILGHSQGASIAYMLRSYMGQLQQDGKLPGDIRIKTYCSAAPKPGNLYYAYDYEYLTRNGWAYTVVNTADWVPETPLTVQTIDDYNTVNPFKGAGAMIKTQKFPNRVVMKVIYNNLRRPAFKLQKRYKNYLGKQTYKMVQKSMKDYHRPEFYNSSNYMRAGSPVILKADSAYYSKFPDDDSKIFIHHFLQPYLYLAEHNL